MPLTILIFLLFFVTLFIGYRYSALKISKILLGIGLFIGMLLAAALMVTAIHSTIAATSLMHQVMRTSDTYNAFYYRLAYILVGLTVILALFKLSTRWISHLNFAMAVASIWLIPLSITTLWLPGLSYIFTWPLLLFELTILLIILIKEWRPSYILPLTVLIIVPTILLVAPIPYLILVALQLARANVAVIFVGLVCGILSIYWQLLLDRLGWYLPTATITIALIFFITAGFVADFNNSQPRPTSLAYFLDTKAEKAYWLSEDRRSNSYISQFIPAVEQKEEAKDLFPDGSLRVSRSDAPLVKDLSGPMITVLSDQRENGNRKLKMAIKSLRDAQWLFVFVTSQTEIISTAINGQEVKDPLISQLVKEGCWGFRHLNISTELEWSLEIKAPDQPVDIVIIDQSFSLPEIAMARAALPAEMMVARSWIANSSLVSNRIRF